MKRIFLLILAAPLALLTPPRVACAQQIYWFDAAFASPTLSRANPDGSNLESIALVAQSLPQGLGFDVTRAHVFGPELAVSGAHVNTGSVNLVGLAPLVSGLSCARGVAVDGNGGKLYWSTTNLVTGPQIVQSNLDGTSPLVLYSAGPGAGTAPRGLALDMAGGMLYAADFDAGSILKIPVNGGAPQTVLGGLAGPSGIAIDDQGGRMYWTEANSNSIRSANLDGTSAVTLVSGLSVPNYIALDVTHSMMYWTEIGTPRVMKAQLNGTGVTQVPASVVAPSGIGFLPVNTTPVTIADVVALPGHGFVELQWSAFVNGSPRFQVFRAEGSGTPFVPMGPEIDAAGGTGFTFRDDAVRPSTEYRYEIGYLEHGAWQYSGITRVVTPAAVFALHPISPNPATGSARLDYELAVGGPVRLEVFDLSGRLVRTLVSTVSEAGVRNVAWDGRSSTGAPVAAGAYFARLTSGGKVATRRLVMMR